MTNKENSASAAQAMQSYKNAGKSAAYIKAVVADEFEMTAKDANDLYNETFGIENTGAQQDLEALVRYMRENMGKMKRKDLVSGMAKASGYTESTANHMFSQLNFAKEYAKQVNKK